MTEHDLLESIGEINEKYINNAQTNTVLPVKRYLKWASLAAALLVVTVSAAIALPRLLSPDNKSVPSTRTVGVNVPEISISDTVSPLSVIPSLVSYNGYVYTACESYIGQEAQIIDQFLVSSLEEGKYALMSYDPDFRIAMRFEETDGAVTICMYERLNGIRLCKGKDLFNTRLCMNTYGKQDIETELNNFIDSINAGDFIHMEELKDSVSRRQYCIYMTDGTRVVLDLIEGGYVGYKWLPGYYVKIPEKTFKKYYEASEDIE